MAEVQQDLPSLRMWRPGNPLPEFSVPQGYTLRLLRNDEGEYWCACCLNDMGVDEVSQALFTKEMLDDPNVPENSIFCIEDENGIPVATATAQIKEGSQAYLHMVAAREDTRGKGLGLPVCAAAIQKHLDEGFKDCLLTTHDWRLGALKHYIKLGFIPVLNHESVRGRWEIILKTLHIPSVQCVNEDLTYADDILASE